jgi:hypothetical protein
VRPSTVLALVALVLGTGCGGDKSAVALSASIARPMLDAQSSTVGADVSGGFSLTMELGDYASGATQVSLGTFSVVRAESELLSPLPLSGGQFPVSIAVGKTVTVPLTFATTIYPDVATQICEDPVQIRGTLTDSLSNDHPTVVTSVAFSATCQ